MFEADNAAGSRSCAEEHRGALCVHGGARGGYSQMTRCFAAYHPGVATIGTAFVQIY